MIHVFPLVDAILPRMRHLRAARPITLWRCIFPLLVISAAQSAAAQKHSAPRSLEDLLRTNDLVVLADVKHGVRDRIAFFSSPFFFAAMRNAGVRHIAIEMPRVLGRQAMGIQTEPDVEAFAQDVVLSNQWHFTDPDGGDDSSQTQYRVAFALGQQVLLAKRHGINPIFYDFNNPLGGFSSYNDPVYRCLAQLKEMAWLRSGLTGKVTKTQRDAAIMRERLSHDDELAAFIERDLAAKGGGKLIVIPGYAHAVIPGGISDRIAARLHRRATVVAVFADDTESNAFQALLREQSRILTINLSRPPQFHYTIASKALQAVIAPRHDTDLDGSHLHDKPQVCYQFAYSR